MNTIKAFIAGLTIPATILPIALLIDAFSGKGAFNDILVVHFVPVVWGFWNVLYVGYFSTLLRYSPRTKIAVAGAVLGALLAVVGVLIVKVHVALGIPQEMSYGAFIGAPLVYAFVWAWAVDALNQMMGISS